jgi:hypothetical protein
MKKTVKRIETEKTEFEIDGEEAMRVLREHYGLPWDAAMEFVFLDTDGDYGGRGDEFSPSGDPIKITGEYEKTVHIGDQGTQLLPPEQWKPEPDLHRLQGRALPRQSSQQH